MHLAKFYIQAGNTARSCIIIWKLFRSSCVRQCPITLELVASYARVLWSRTGAAMYIRILAADRKTWDAIHKIQVQIQVAYTGKLPRYSWLLSYPFPQTWVAALKQSCGFPHMDGEGVTLAVLLCCLNSWCLSPQCQGLLRSRSGAVCFPFLFPLAVSYSCARSEYRENISPGSSFQLWGICYLPCSQGYK